MWTVVPLEGVGARKEKWFGGANWPWGAFKRVFLATTFFSLVLSEGVKRNA